MFKIILLVVLGALILLIIAAYLVPILQKTFSSSGRSIEERENEEYNSMRKKKMKIELEELDIIKKYRPYYTNLIKIPFMKSILESLRNRYALTLKGKMELCQAKAAKLVVNYIWIVTVISTMYTIYLGNIYGLLISITVCTGVFLLRFDGELNSLVLALLIDLDICINRIIYHYSYSGDIITALRDTASETNGKAKAHLIEIADALSIKPLLGQSVQQEISEEDMINNAIMNYTRGYNNTFISRLFMLCATSITFGEAKSSEQNTFIQGLSELRADIFDYSLLMKKHAKIVTGNLGIILLPLVLISPLANFGRNLISGIEVYYEGIYEVLGYVGSLIATVFVFLLCRSKSKLGTVLKDRDPIISKISSIKFINRMVNRYYFSNYNKELILNKLIKNAGSKETKTDIFVVRCLYSLGVFVISVIVMFTVTTGLKSSKLTKDDTIRSYTVNYSKDTMDNSLKLHHELISNSHEYYSVTLEEIESMYLEVLPAHNSALYEILAKTTYSQIVSINNIYIRWWYMLIIIVVSLSVSYVPIYLLNVRAKRMDGDKLVETIRLQSIICCLKDHETMSISIMLEWMERFSLIFRSSITEALSALPLGEEEALDNLYASDTYEPFKRIVTSLKMSDMIGIKMAFIELENDKKSLILTQEFEQEQMLEKLKSTVLGYQLVPFFVVVGFYFVLPLLLYMATTGMAMFANMNNVLPN